MEKFDKNKLKNAETVEKNVLPSADDIAKEKEANWFCNFRMWITVIYVRKEISEIKPQQSNIKLAFSYKIEICQEKHHIF